MPLGREGAVFNIVRWLIKNLLESERVFETHPYVPDSLNVDAGSPRPTAVISERPSTLIKWET